MSLNNNVPDIYEIESCSCVDPDGSADFHVG
jgi:hypothetical protein